MRPCKNAYFMWFAVVASTRATCDRRSVGCAIVDVDGRILATGYNGSSPGAPHCDDAGHLMVRGGCIRTTHAEANAIGHAARSGTALLGSTAYVTCHPCPGCLKLLIAAGVVRVVYLEPYHGDKDGASAELAGYAGIRIEPYQDDAPWEEGIASTD